MSEKISIPDVIPQFGITRSAWESRTRNQIQRERAGAFLSRSHHFILPKDDPYQAALLTTEFNQFTGRVIEAATLFKLPILHLIFSRELELGASEDKVEIPPYAAVSRIALAEKGLTKDTPWEGLVTIDFTKQEEWPNSWQKALERSSTPGSNVLPFYKDGLRNRAVLIIDGYGRIARQIYGFSAFDDNANAGIQITRVSEEQTKADTDFGSLWFTKGQSVNKLDDISANTQVSLSQFDLRRFNRLADLIIFGLVKIEEDPEFVLQVANHHGKTTILHALDRELQEQGNGTVLVASVLTNGFIFTSSGSEIVLDSISPTVQYLILDEAGRVSLQPKTVDLLEQIQQRGIRVLRLYPGNFNPPTEKVLRLTPEQ